MSNSSVRRPAETTWLDEIGGGEDAVHVLLQGQHADKQGVGLPPAGLEVLHTAQHRGGAQDRAPVLKVLSRHPASRQYAVIERQGFIAADKGRGINKAEELLARLRMNPEVHTDHVLALDRAAGFFEHLANSGVFGRLIGLDVTTGLAENTPAHRTLFDEQVLGVVLDNSSDCQVGWIHPC